RRRGRSGVLDEVVELVVLHAQDERLPLGARGGDDLLRLVGLPDVDQVAFSGGDFKAVLVAAVLHLGPDPLQLRRLLRRDPRHARLPCLPRALGRCVGPGDHRTGAAAQRGSERSSTRARPAWVVTRPRMTGFAVASRTAPVAVWNRMSRKRESLPVISSNSPFTSPSGSAHDHTPYSSSPAP